MRVISVTLARNSLIANFSVTIQSPSSVQYSGNKCTERNLNSGVLVGGVKRGRGGVKTIMIIVWVVGAVRIDFHTQLVTFHCLCWWCPLDLSPWWLLLPPLVSWQYLGDLPVISCCPVNRVTVVPCVLSYYRGGVEVWWLSAKDAFPSWMFWSLKSKMGQSAWVSIEKLPSPTSILTWLASSTLPQEISHQYPPEQG